jgi:hypothetical protein
MQVRIQVKKPVVVKLLRVDIKSEEADAIQAWNLRYDFLSKASLNSSTSLTRSVSTLRLRYIGSVQILGSAGLGSGGMKDISLETTMRRAGDR